MIEAISGNISSLKETNRTCSQEEQASRLISGSININTALGWKDEIMIMNG